MYIFNCKWSPGRSSLLLDRHHGHPDDRTCFNFHIRVIVVLQIHHPGNLVSKIPIVQGITD